MVITEASGGELWMAARTFFMEIWLIGPLPSAELKTPTKGLLAMLALSSVGGKREVMQVLISVILE